MNSITGVDTANKKRFCAALTVLLLCHTNYCIRALEIQRHYIAIHPLSNLLRQILEELSRTISYLVPLLSNLCNSSGPMDLGVPRHSKKIP
jgi:hypothetical protein